MMGHPIGASSAIQAALTAMSIRRGVIPPTINLDDPDPELNLNVVAGEARESDQPYALCNAFGFGGHNASLVLAR